MNHAIYNVSASFWYIYLEKVFQIIIKFALYISTVFSFSSFSSSSSFCITNTVNNISINISLFPKSIEQQKNEFILSQLCCDDFNSISHIFRKSGMCLRRHSSPFCIAIIITRHCSPWNLMLTLPIQELFVKDKVELRDNTTSNIGPLGSVQTASVLERIAFTFILFLINIYQSSE